MNEENGKTSFNYEEEKKNLIKKLTIFGVIMIAFTILFKVGTSESSIFSCLMMGVLFGCVFYIPGRLHSYFHLGWIMTIIIAVGFLLVLLFLADKIGPIVYLILLLPIADMGYSIYKVVSYKRQNGSGEEKA